jgi:hypothetical protein
MPDPAMKAILIGELDIFCCTLLFAMFASRGDLFFISGAPEQQEKVAPRNCFSKCVEDMEAVWSIQRVERHFFYTA